MINETLKILEKLNPGTIKALHDAMGIDYMKPYDVITYDGNFTPKKLRKALTVAGVNEDSITMGLSVDNYKNVRWFWLYGEEVGVSVCWVNWENACAVNDFGTKSYFDEYRKHTNIRTFLISQDPEYITKVVKKSVELKRNSEPGDRLIITWSCGGSCDGIHYVSQFDAIDREMKIKYHWQNRGRCFTRSEILTENISGIIDKSGFYILGNKIERKRKAEALRAKREQEKANAFNCDLFVEDVTKRAVTMFNETKKAFNDATTPEQLNKIAEVCSGWSGLRWRCIDIERFKKKVAGKNYNSIDAIKIAYNHIIEDSDKYIAELHEVVKGV